MLNFRKQILFILFLLGSAGIEVEAQTLKTTVAGVLKDGIWNSFD